MDHFTIREVTVNYRGPKRKAGSITEPWLAAEFIRKVLPNNSQEHFIAVYLAGDHSPIAYSVVHTGTAICSPASSREVLQRGCLLGACGLIVAHNHPSGASDPSPQDRDITEKLRQAAELVGMKLLDHLVVTETEFTSIIH
ncbi:JAB domain-containing protein [Isosphaeraceae bacterium EP7]